MTHAFNFEKNQFIRDGISESHHVLPKFCSTHREYQNFTYHRQKKIFFRTPILSIPMKIPPRKESIFSKFKRKSSQQNRPSARPHNRSAAAPDTGEAAAPIMQECGRPSRVESDHRQQHPHRRRRRHRHHRHDHHQQEQQEQQEQQRVIAVFK